MPRVVPRRRSSKLLRILLLLLGDSDRRVGVKPKRDGDDVDVDDFDDDEEDDDGGCEDTLAGVNALVGVDGMVQVCLGLSFACN